MLCLNINSFEKSLLPSNIAPAFEGPTTKTVLSSGSLLIKSTIPSIKGISGPTITRSTERSIIEFFNSLKFKMSISKFSATFKVPAFPGATYIFSTPSDSLSFQQKACSLAPDPIIKIFILQI